MVEYLLVNNMKINILASGSKGNCCYIETREYKILVDVGISNKRITEALHRIDVNLNEINVICITHEHSDHISGLAQVLKTTNAMLILTEGTYKGIFSSKNKDIAQALLTHQSRGLVKLLDKEYLLYKTIQFDTLKIIGIATFHDSFESCGYVFEDEKSKLVYITDTGYVHHDLESVLRNADAYILETNHDPQILMASSRPYYLKVRILSDHGHMSNEDAFILLANLLTEKTKYVFCAHISEECNMTEIIDYTREIVYKKLGFLSNAAYIMTSQQQSKVYEI